MDIWIYPFANIFAKITSKKSHNAKNHPNTHLQKQKHKIELTSILLLCSLENWFVKSFILLRYSCVYAGLSICTCCRLRYISIPFSWTNIRKRISSDILGSLELASLPLFCGGYPAGATLARIQDHFCLHFWSAYIEIQNISSKIWQFFLIFGTHY